MRSIFYIMSLVSLGFPYPSWADATTLRVELSESNSVGRVELEEDHQVEVTLDRPDFLNGQRLVIGLEPTLDGINPKLLNSFSLNLITIDQKNVDDQKTKMVVRMGTSTAVIGKILTSSIQNLRIGTVGIEFELPMLADLKDLLQMKVKMVRDNRIYQDVPVLDRDFDLFSYAEVSGSHLKVRIPADQIDDGYLVGKKFNLQVSVRMKAMAKEVLNGEDLMPIFEHRLEKELMGVVAQAN